MDHHHYIHGHGHQIAQCPEGQGWVLGTKVCKNLKPECSPECSEGSFESDGRCYETIFTRNANPDTFQNVCAGLTVSPDGTKCGTQIGSVLPVGIL